MGVGDAGDVCVCVGGGGGGAGGGWSGNWRLSCDVVDWLEHFWVMPVRGMDKTTG